MASNLIVMEMNDGRIQPHMDDSRTAFHVQPR